MLCNRSGIKKIMTSENFIKAGIPIEDSSVSLLYAEAALSWIKNNTSLNLPDDLSRLPPGGKLFILKFSEIMSADRTVTSESLGGMSQSFSSESRETMLYDLARELLPDYMKSQVTFMASQSRWK